MPTKKVTALGGVIGTGAVALTTAEGLGIPTGLAELGSGALLVTLVAFVILSIFRGWIVVKLHYDTLLDRAKAAESAVVELTKNNAALASTNDIQTRIIDKQTAVADTVEKVMGAIQGEHARFTGGSS